MCSYQTLYYNQSGGYIIRCLQCNNIQLAFGNVAITLPGTEFPAFFDLIKKFAGNLSSTDVVHSKTIYIPTPCDGIKLLLSHTELKELVAMLDIADSELKTLHLLDLFQQN
ncbi:MAG TPA: DUF6686 family protein [Chitinophagaceae bacterium]|nr:DUF6686 family protein [Chitinophagaceae bacterium]